MNYVIQSFLCILLSILSIVPVTCGPRHRIIHTTSNENYALCKVQADLLCDLDNDLPMLRSNFDNKIKANKIFLQPYIAIDYKHIFGIDLQFLRNGGVKLKGFHHDFNNRVERNGIVKFIKKAQNRKGFYSADIFYQGRYIATKSFFPAHWNRKTVIKKIYEAYNNFIKSGTQFTLDPSGSYTVNGITNDGVTIRMYISKQGKIKTAFPMI